MIAAMRKRVEVRMASRVLFVVMVLMTLAACATKNNNPTLGLDVDIYLHPTSADPTDIILQTAITKRLNDSAVTRNSLIHVRVENKTVYLTGTAKDNVRSEAERIAIETELTLNGEAIRPNKSISNKITTK